MTTPRYLTPRTSPYGYGPQIAKVSKLLGRPLMPWQLAAAGLIGETDAAGRFVHPVVAVTVPRQSGKTALLAAVMTHRTTMRQAARVWYTAQTGIKAREQMWEMMDAVDLSPLRTITRSKRGAGDTSIEIPALGSRIRAHPPTPDSLHGNQSDLNVIDEAWYFDEALAAGLMGAITPTQATRPNAQTIIVSTAGTASSTWFHDFVDRGHAGEVCLIDYGVGPDVDASDFEAIADAHPAIGHTQEASILVTARAQMSEGEFMRAYGNRRTSTFERLIPLEYVELATVTDDLPDGMPVFGVGVSFERDDVVIVAAVARDGVPHFEVVERYGSLTPAVAKRCAELTERHGGAIGIAPAGPAGALADDVEQLDGRVVRVPDADLADATGDFLDRIRRPMYDPAATPGLFLRSHPAFSDALDAVALRTSGDRLFWSRRTSAGSIAAVEAATVALHALDNQPAPPVPPMIWS